MADMSKPGRLIRVPNLLASKVGGSAGEGLDSALIKEAEARTGELAAAYGEWLRTDLDRLEKLTEALTRADGDPAAQLQQIFGILHNFKGNGAAFGYDLITAIAQSACPLVRNQTSLDADRRKALRHHVAALHVVVDLDIKGSGGAAGTRLLERLALFDQPSAAG